MYMESGIFADNQGGFLALLILTFYKETAFTSVWLIFTYASEYRNLLFFFFTQQSALEIFLCWDLES